MNSLQRFKQAPLTVTEAKTNIFAPYEKKRTEITGETTIYQDEFYKIELKGYRLNQLHRDILDIALFYGDNKLENLTNDQRPIRLFSLYQIQKLLGYKSRFNNEWLEEKFREMEQTLIQITTKNSDWIRFKIIDIAKYSKKQNKYALVISELYMEFFEKEISIGYKEYLPLILKLNPQTRALVRFLISHTHKIQIRLDKAMNIIGINETTKQNFRYHRRRILEDIEKLKELNIEITKQTNDARRKDDYIVRYVRLPNIRIYYPEEI